MTFHSAILIFFLSSKTPVFRKKTTFASKMNRPPIIPTIIGTGFGAGFCPFAPGTAGAVLATLLWWGGHVWLTDEQNFFVTLALVIIFTLLGTWATQKLMPFWGEDPSRVVVDEMVGVWIPLLFADHLWTAVAALILFRFFDIVKPFGIRALDNRKGAFWVMADDILAGIYSAILLIIIIHIVEAWGR